MVESAKQRCSNDTLVSLREYLEARIAAVEAGIVAAKESADMRLEGMNQFRQQIERERSFYVPRGEYQIARDGLEKAVHEQQLKWSNLEGKASQSSVIGAYVVAGVGWVLAIGFGIAGLIFK
jgi:hypothetical protein